MKRKAALAATDGAMSGARRTTKSVTLGVVVCFRYAGQTRYIR
jgi:hypothetical protein